MDYNQEDSTATASRAFVLTVSTGFVAKNHNILSRDKPSADETGLFSRVMKSTSRTMNMIRARKHVQRKSKDIAAIMVSKRRNPIPHSTVHYSHSDVMNPPRRTLCYDNNRRMGYHVQSPQQDYYVTDGSEFINVWDRDALLRGPIPSARFFSLHRRLRLLWPSCLRPCSSSSSCCNLFVSCCVHS